MTEVLFPSLARRDDAVVALPYFKESQRRQGRKEPPSGQLISDPGLSK
jgi:hypothetical protein